MCVATPQVSPSGSLISEDSEAHDATAYDGLMQQRDSDPGAMLADKGYDSDALSASDSAGQRRDTRDPDQEQPQGTVLDQQTALCAAVTD